MLYFIIAGSKITKFPCGTACQMCRKKFRFGHGEGGGLVIEINCEVWSIIPSYR